MVPSTWHVWVIGAAIVLTLMVVETVQSEKGKQEFAKMADQFGVPVVAGLIALVAVIAWPLIVAMVINGLIQERKGR
jgi:uncharacterized integral membrane protein